MSRTRYKCVKWSWKSCAHGRCFTESRKAQALARGERVENSSVWVDVGAAKRGRTAGVGVVREGRCVGVLRCSFYRGAWQSIGEALTSSGWERSVPTKRFIRTRAGKSGRAFFSRARARSIVTFFSMHAAPISAAISRVCFVIFLRRS